MISARYKCKSAHSSTGEDFLIHMKRHTELTGHLGEHRHDTGSMVSPPPLTSVQFNPLQFN